MGSGQTHVAETRPRRHRFGDFTLDLDGAVLHRGAEEITLRPKSFDALTYLVERHGRLVTKTELIEAIWPDTAVTDNSLAQCLLDIRRALGDEGQQMIRTVARRGYVFAAPVITPVLEPAHASGESPEAQAILPDLLSGPLHQPRTWKAITAVVVVLAIVGGGILLLRSTQPRRKDLTYTQLTNFTDSAVAPALSPDGRMLAFIRGDNPFISSDQIYVKMLPNGEAIQLTHDPRQKYSVAFSPDGSKIAYTVYAAAGRWSTYAISSLGGEPSLLVANAAGLTWLDEHQLLFSETKSGVHMGIVTARENRAEHRELYFPQHERAMAHYSYASPDRHWALAIEMDDTSVWQPCRLVHLEGSSPVRQVGPRGACTSAGWSPDGNWMYFTVVLDGEFHLWRQRFPNSEPEQLTFGPTEENGISVATDGSLVTSIGVQQSAIWIHEPRGDRPLSSEGLVEQWGKFSYAAADPSFSLDARHLYYLRRKSPGTAAELWQADILSGNSGPVLPEISMGKYNISRDGTEVVFTTHPARKPSELWVAPLNRSSPPTQIASGGEHSPFFGSAGQVLFGFAENNANYVGQMNKDRSGRSKVFAYPVSAIQNISPDRRWVIAMTPLFNGETGAATMAVPTGEGSARTICSSWCPSAWSPDGRFLYVQIEPKSRTSPGKMIALAVAPETGLPELPEAGIQSAAQAIAIPGSRVVEQAGIVPGLDPDTYAYVKTTVHRNLFRIALP